jgi:hypothetical protein
VGHRDFAVLDQAKDSFKLRVRIKEHVMHSGIMHYYASTFQNKFKEEVVSLETHKFQIPGQSIKHGLLSLPVTCVFSLLQSDDLKVDDENTVLSFVYHYCR